MISVTNSNSVVHKITIVNRFDFGHTKVIAHTVIRSTNYEVFMDTFFKAKNHSMQATMLSDTKAIALGQRTIDPICVYVHGNSSKFVF